MLVLFGASLACACGLPVCWEASSSVQRPLPSCREDGEKMGRESGRAASGVPERGGALRGGSLKSYSSVSTGRGVVGGLPQSIH